MEMVRAFLSSIALALAYPSLILASTTTVNPGETLSEIAKRHNTTLSALMQENDITNPNELYIGQKISLPSNKIQLTEKTHTVRPGENLGLIASRYQVSEDELIRLNNIKNPNHLYIGQQVKVLIVEPQDNINSTSNQAKGIRKTLYHIVSRGQTMSEISKIYNIPSNKIAAMNNIKDENKLMVGRKLYLDLENLHTSEKSVEDFKVENKDVSTSKEIRKAEFRNYGPLQVDWSNWTLMNGSYVAPTLHKNGKALYLAINCPSKKINATGPNGVWKNWIAPVDNFEHNIVNDLCNLKKT